MDRGSSNSHVALRITRIARSRITIRADSSHIGGPEASGFSLDAYRTLGRYRPYDAFGINTAGCRNVLATMHTLPIRTPDVGAPIVRAFPGAFPRNHIVQRDSARCVLPLVKNQSLAR